MVLQFLCRKVRPRSLLRCINKKIKPLLGLEPRISRLEVWHVIRLRHRGKCLFERNVKKKCFVLWTHGDSKNFYVCIYTTKMLTHIIFNLALWSAVLIPADGSTCSAIKMLYKNENSYCGRDLGNDCVNYGSDTVHVNTHHFFKSRLFTHIPKNSDTCLSICLRPFQSIGIVSRWGCGHCSGSKNKYWN